MMTRTATAFLNTVANYARFAVSIVVLILLTPYMINKLGGEQYGLWNLVLSSLGFFGLLDLGFGAELVKSVAENRSRADAGTRNEIMSTLGAVYVVLALIATLFILILSLTFGRIFSIPPEQRSLAILLLWIAGLRIAILSLPLGLFRGALFGEQKIYLINLVQIATIIGSAVGTWLVLRSGHGLVGVAWVALGAMLVEHAAYAFFCVRLMPGLRLSPRLVSFQRMRGLASFTFHSFLGGVASLILLRTDPIIVKFFLPLAAVGIYAVVLKIVENATLLIKQFINVMGPMVAEFKGSGEEIKIRFVLVNCTKFALAPGMALAVAIGIHGRDALSAWAGPDFAAGASVLRILLVSMAIAIPQMVASTVLAMTGLHQLTGRAAILSAVLNVVASVILARPLGMAGIALGTLLATLLVDVFIILPQACASRGVPLPSYARRALLPAVWPAIPQAAVSLALMAWSPGGNLLHVAMLAAPGGILYGLLFLLFGLDPTEKELVREKLIRRRRAPPAAEGMGK